MSSGEGWGVSFCSENIKEDLIIGIVRVYPTHVRVDDDDGSVTVAGLSLN